MKKIIHKHFLVNKNDKDKLDLNDNNLKYLCNRKVKWGNWLKTDVTNKKVNCKNCLKIIKNKDLYNKLMVVEEL